MVCRKYIHELIIFAILLAFMLGIFLVVLLVLNVLLVFIHFYLTAIRYFTATANYLMNLVHLTNIQPLLHKLRVIRHYTQSDTTSPSSQSQPQLNKPKTIENNYSNPSALTKSYTKSPQPNTYKRYTKKYNPRPKKSNPPQKTLPPCEDLTQYTPCCIYPPEAVRENPALARNNIVQCGEFIYSDSPIPTENIPQVSISSESISSNLLPNSNPTQLSAATDTPPDVIYPGRDIQCYNCKTLITNPLAEANLR